MFWSTFFGMIAAMIVMQIGQFIVGYYFSRKQQKEQEAYVKNIEQKMKDQGLDPEKIEGFTMIGDKIIPMTAEGVPIPIPTAKLDKDDKEESVGQYL